MRPAPYLVLALSALVLLAPAASAAAHAFAWNIWRTIGSAEAAVRHPSRVRTTDTPVVPMARRR